MNSVARIGLGSDDAGFPLKQILWRHLLDQGLPVTDYGCNTPDPVDYPDIALAVARDIVEGRIERGILVCGTGIGMAIAANKVVGVYAAQAHDTYSAERARKSNNAQIITLGARVVGTELAKQIVDRWLESEFSSGASARKVEKIAAAEKRP
jgi:ribose 5-phosphate isomerase B